MSWQHCEETTEVRRCCLCSQSCRMQHIYAGQDEEKKYCRVTMTGQGNVELLRIREETPTRTRISSSSCRGAFLGRAYPRPFCRLERPCQARNEWQCVGCATSRATRVIHKMRKTLISILPRSVFTETVPSSAASFNPLQALRVTQ